MSVYVDGARNPFQRMLMRHILAGGVDELFDMADRIGLVRRHFQPGSFPHFDLRQSYRLKAIRAGAVVVDRRDLVEVIRRYSGRTSHDLEELARLRSALRQQLGGEPRPRSRS